MSVFMRSVPRNVLLRRSMRDQDISLSHHLQHVSFSSMAPKVVEISRNSKELNRRSQEPKMDVVLNLAEVDESIFEDDTTRHNHVNKYIQSRRLSPAELIEAGKKLFVNHGLEPGNCNPDNVVRVVAMHAEAHKKHVMLFAGIRDEIKNSLHKWDAESLGRICKSWAEIGALRENFMLMISDRVAETVAEASTESLVYILDCYASLRLNPRSATEAICSELLQGETLIDTDRDLIQPVSRIRQMHVSIAALLASALARLNIRNINVLNAIRWKVIDVVEDDSVNARDRDNNGYNIGASEYPVSARDTMLLAYSFSKLKLVDLDFFLLLTRLGISTSENLTANDLRMLAVAMDRSVTQLPTESREIFLSELPELFSNMSIRAQRVIGQFSGESLIGFLGSVSSLGFGSEQLLARVLGYLPRLSLSMQVSDLIHMGKLLVSFKVESGDMSEVFATCLAEKEHNHYSSIQGLCLLASMTSSSPPGHALQAYIHGFTSSVKIPSDIRPHALVELVETVAQFNIRDHVLMSQITGVAQPSLMTPSQAADFYCAYAKLGAFDLGNAHYLLMQQMMSKSLVL